MNKKRCNFKINEITKQLYTNFIKNILNTYRNSKLLNDTNLRKLTYIYDKTNTFMLRIQEEITNTLREFENIYIKNDLNIDMDMDMDMDIDSTMSKNQNMKFQNLSN